MSLDAYHALTTTPEPEGPLVFAFHGTGGDEQQFFHLAQTLVPGAGVVSPRGDVSEMGATRFFRRTGEGVYDMADLSRATRKMATFVELWKNTYPRRPTFAFGYSNGANILASVLIAKPDLFDRVGLLHPLIPWSPKPVPGLKGTRVLITAGRNDPICPWTLTHQLVEWTRAQNADVSTTFHAGGHEIRQEEIASLTDFLNLKSTVVKS